MTEPPALICSDCPAPISRQSKGRCKPCSARRLNSDPEFAARRRAGMTAYVTRPEVRQMLTARLTRHMRNLSPEEAAWRSEQGRRIAATVLQTETVRALSNSAEAKAKAGRNRTDTVLAWCPPDYRDRYRQLKASQRLSAAEARSLIEVEPADARRRDAAMTPFERKLAKVARGEARVIAVPPLPSRSYDTTLGGVATGLL